MNSVFSWQSFVSLCPASSCTPGPNLPVTPGILISYFYILVPYDEKSIIFFCINSRKSYRSSQSCSTSASLALVVGPQTCITVILNGLPWKRTEIILSLLRLHHVLHFDSFVKYVGYSISSKGFFPTVVDIMVIRINFAHSSPFSSLIPKMSMFTLAISYLPLPINLDSGS